MSGQCSIRGCKNKFKNSPLKFFRLPHDKNLAKAWLRCCRPHTKTGMVCEVHFSPKDFRTKKPIAEVPKNNKKLKSNAIPSRYIIDKTNTVFSIERSDGEIVRFSTGVIDVSKLDSGTVKTSADLATIVSKYQEIKALRKKNEIINLKIKVPDHNYSKAKTNINPVEINDKDIRILNNNFIENEPLTSNDPGDISSHISDQRSDPGENQDHIDEASDDVQYIQTEQLSAEEQDKRKIFSWQKENFNCVDDLYDDDELFYRGNLKPNEPENQVNKSENVAEPSAEVNDGKTQHLPVEHKDYSCNKCEGDIIGFRYTCVQCDSYDLCSTCEKKMVHSRHFILRIPKPRPSTEINEIIQGIRAKLKILNIEDDGPEDTLESECVLDLDMEVKEDDDPLKVPPEAATPRDCSEGMKMTRTPEKKPYRKSTRNNNKKIENKDIENEDSLDDNVEEDWDSISSHTPKSWKDSDDSGDDSDSSMDVTWLDETILEDDDLHNDTENREIITKTNAPKVAEQPNVKEKEQLILNYGLNKQNETIVLKTYSSRSQKPLKDTSNLKTGLHSQTIKNPMLPIDPINTATQDKMFNKVPVVSIERLNITGLQNKMITRPIILRNPSNFGLKNQTLNPMKPSDPLGTSLQNKKIEKVPVVLVDHLNIGLQNKTLQKPLTPIKPLNMGSQYKIITRPIIVMDSSKSGLQNQTLNTNEPIDPLITDLQDTTSEKVRKVPIEPSSTGLENKKIQSPVIPSEPSNTGLQNKTLKSPVEPVALSTNVLTKTIDPLKSPVKPVALSTNVLTKTIHPLKSPVKPVALSTSVLTKTIDPSNKAYTITIDRSCKIPTITIDPLNKIPTATDHSNKNSLTSVDPSNKGSVTPTDEQSKGLQKKVLNVPKVTQDEILKKVPFTPIDLRSKVPYIPMDPSKPTRIPDKVVFYSVVPQKQVSDVKSKKVFKVKHTGSKLTKEKLEQILKKCLGKSEVKLVSINKIQ